MSFVNNRKFQPYLIGFVLILWVLIGIRIYGYLQPEEENDPIAIVQRPKLVKEEETTWKPDFGYRDPFLKHARHQPAKVEPGTKDVRPVSKKKEEVIKLPELSKPVKYEGFIQNGHTSERIGIFNIFGTTHLQQAGEMMDSIYVKELHADRAVLVEKDKEFVITSK